MKTFTHAFLSFILSLLLSAGAYAQSRPAPTVADPGVSDSRHSPTPGSTQPKKVPLAFVKAASAARQTGRFAGKIGKWAAKATGIKNPSPALKDGAVNLTPSHTRNCDCGPQVVHIKEGEWFFFPAPLFAEFISDSLSYLATLAGGEPLPEWIFFQPIDHSFMAASKNFKTGMYPIRFVCFNGREQREKAFKIHVESPKGESPASKHTGRARGKNNNISLNLRPFFKF